MSSQELLKDFIELNLPLYLRLVVCIVDEKNFLFYL